MRWLQSSQKEYGYQVVKELDNKRIKVSRLQGFDLSMHKELRLRTWDLAIYYYHNCTELGQTKVFQVIDYVASQSKRIDKDSSEKGVIKSSSESRPPPPNTIFSFNRISKRPTQKKVQIPSDPPVYNARVMMSKH
ncbi:hypothetical protein AgCh_000088 [Apium graveolens]